MSEGRAPVALALRALGLGDFLTAVPALRGIARGFPEHRVVVAAPPALAPLAALVREVHGLVPAAPLAPIAGAGRVDVAVNLHGRGPQSHRALLALRPGRLVAFAHPEVPASRGGPAFDESEHEVARWCRLLRTFGIPADPGDLDLELDDEPPLHPGYALLHPGAASPARRWPPERFAALGRELARRGRRVLVMAGPGEARLAREVAEWAGLGAGAVPEGGDLRAAARLVRHASLLVCGDTGIGHLATALGTPSVLLFGPMPPSLWGPPASRPRHRVLHRGLRGDPHGARLDPGLAAIGVDEVLAAIDGLEREASPVREARAAARP